MLHFCHLSLMSLLKTQFVSFGILFSTFIFHNPNIVWRGAIRAPAKQHLFVMRIFGLDRSSIEETGNVQRCPAGLDPRTLQLEATKPLLEYFILNQSVVRHSKAPRSSQLVELASSFWVLGQVKCLSHSRAPRESYYGSFWLKSVEIWIREETAMHVLI